MKIGADPELFLKQQEQNKFISGIDLIGGSKHYPRQIRDDGCAIQEDNVAAEFNIPPCETVDRFIESINFTLDNLSQLAKGYGLSLAIVPSAVFDQDQLNHPQAMEFGCDPDFNCWTRQRNPRPKTENKQLRVAGGHVHAGCLEEGIDPWNMGRAMDLFLGVPSLQYDNDQERRKLYGKAGAVRIKPYGVEYRTLSNFWLKSDELKTWVFNQTNKAKDFCKAGGKFTKEEGDRIQYCINSSDMALMKTIQAEYNL